MKYFRGTIRMVVLGEDLVEVGETSRGDKIYRSRNNAGGHTYWSDSIGGGVVIWDTCLASEEELLLAMKIEKECPDVNPPDSA